MSDWQIVRARVSRSGPMGLGLAVTGGTDAAVEGDPAITISDVKTGGPAEKALKPGDRILSVNGNSMVDVTHEQAIEILRNAGTDVDMVVNRNTGLYSPPTAIQRTVFNMGGSMSSPLSPSAPAPFLPDRYRSDNNRYSIQQQLSNSQPKNLLPLPPKPSPTSNNFPVQQPRYPRGENINNRIDRSLNMNHIEPNTTGNLRVIELKQWQDLGVHLTSRLYVSSVDFDSPAHQFGIRSGDTLLALNGVESAHLSLVDARKLLHREEVKFRIVRDLPPSRDGSSHPPPVVVLEPTFIRPKSSRTTGMFNADPRAMQSNKNGPNERIVEKRISANLNSAPKSFSYDSVPHDKTDFTLSSDVPRLNLTSLSEGHCPVAPTPTWQVPGPSRTLVFSKDPVLGTGVRITGGNSIGIFISDVHPQSQANQKGLRRGDRLLSVNGVDLRGKIHEEAVLLMVAAESPVTLEVCSDIPVFENFVNNKEFGDSFYIRVYFTYRPPAGSTDIAFEAGDVLHVSDTLVGGLVGTWNAVRVFPNPGRAVTGHIPNYHRAEQLALTSGDDNSSAPRGNEKFLFNTIRKRSKSLSSALNSSLIMGGMPAYQFVHHIFPGFVRPVAVFGALSDIARNRLIRQFPEKFEEPYIGTRPGGRPEPLKLSSIKTVIENQKHCVVDVTPESVERLIRNRYAPLVIFLQPVNKTQLRQFGERYSHLSRAAQIKNTWNQSKMLSTRWRHIFTETVPLTLSEEDWFGQVLSFIKQNQNSMCWMPVSRQNQRLNQSVSESNDDDVFLSHREDLTRSSAPSLPQAMLASQSNSNNRNTRRSLPYSGEPMTRSHSDPHLNEPSDEEIMGRGRIQQRPRGMTHDTPVSVGRGGGRQLMNASRDEEFPGQSGSGGRRWIPPEMDIEQARLQYSNNNTSGRPSQFDYNPRPELTRPLPIVPASVTNGQPQSGPYKSSGFIEVRQNNMMHSSPDPQFQLQRREPRDTDFNDRYLLRGKTYDEPDSQKKYNFHSYSREDRDTSGGIGPIKINGNPNYMREDRNPAFTTNVRPLNGFNHQDQLVYKPQSSFLPVSPAAQEDREIVAEASGRFDHQGGTLDVYGTGVKLHIPEGALPYNANQQVFIKIFRDIHQPSLPGNRQTSLVSPTVMCGPQQLRFSRPVELIMPHQPGLQDPHEPGKQWSFSLLHASSERGGARPQTWNETPLLLKGIARQIDDRTIAVSVDHF